MYAPPGETVERLQAQRFKINFRVEHAARAVGQQVELVQPAIPKQVHNVLHRLQHAVALRLAGDKDGVGVAQRVEDALVQVALRVVGHGNLRA